MSAEGLPDELTGAFLEIAEVTDLGVAEETETVVGSTTADVTIENDQTRAEGNKHSQRRQLSKPTYNAVSLEVPSLLVPSGGSLEAFGVLDAQGEEQYGQTWEAARIHIYDVPPDEATGDPQASFEFEDTEWELDSIEMGEDFSEITCVGYVHGVYRRGTTSP